MCSARVSGAVGLPQPASALGDDARRLHPVPRIPLRNGELPQRVADAGGLPTSSPSASRPPLQSSCAAFAAQTGPLTNGIYGGDFPVQTATNLPTTGLPDPNQAAVQANGGFGNCDLAVDLGTESSTSSGLYPAATIWIGSTYFANTTSPAGHILASGGRDRRPVERQTRHLRARAGDHHHKLPAAPGLELLSHAIQLIRLGKVMPAAPHRDQAPTRIHTALTSRGLQ